MQPAQPATTPKDGSSKAAATSTLSIDDLLRPAVSTTENTENDYRNVPPPPPYGSSQPAQEIYTAPAPPKQKPFGNGPEKGVYRGCYYFTGAEGETVIMRLSNLPVRFFGAVIDYIICILLTIGFYIFLSIAIGVSSIFIRDSSFGGSTTRYSSSSSGSSFFDLVLSNLLSIIIYGTIPFLYHVSSLLFSGRTVGHRTFGIKVIREGGNPVSLISAVLRAIWGIGYGFLLFIIAGLLVDLVFPILMGQTRNARNGTEFARMLLDSMLLLFVFVMVIYVVGYMLVLMVMLLDKGRQGMHDKMAGTYVVDARPLSGKI
jgi:uncharacterized RDD family membrane protein YckC